MPGTVSTGRTYALEVNGDKHLLLVESFTFSEALSQIPVITLQLLVENSKAPVAFASIVGADATLTMEYRDDSLDEPEKIRAFEGILRSLTQGPQDADFTSYQAELVPKLWALSQSVTCRAFLQRKYGEIAQQIASEGGISIKVASILNSYPVRWVCQYEESSLDFLQRILEQEGVAYYFDPSQRNRLTLAYDSNEFANLSPASLAYGEDIETWERCQGVRPTKWEVLDWSYRQARVIAGASVKGSGELPAGLRRAVEYPLPLDGLGHAQRMADVRLDEARADRIVYRGKSFMPTLAPGHVFTLTKHFSDNGKYLVVAVNHMATAGTDIRSGSGSEQWYENEFVCVPEATKWRPPRLTPRPRVYGVQPAVVTNLKEDPQETPVYCRVKVKFTWGDGSSTPVESDWLRVAHPWASSAWGFQFQPRVNDEVLVTFENGDPDRGVIVGGAYNFSHQAPWPKMWQEEAGGIRSQKGNELIFYDKPGQETLKLYAKREHQLLVEKDSLTEVKGDLHETVTGKKCEAVTGNLAQKVTGTAQVQSVQAYKLGSDMQLHLSGGMTVAIEAGAQLTLKVGGSSVSISPAGVAIQGPLIRLNSGGGAGSCEKPSPEAPLKPAPPGSPGQSSPPPTTTTSTPQVGSPGSGSGGTPSSSGGGQGSSGQPLPPVVQERMSAPSFRKLFQSIGGLFGGKKGEEKPKKGKKEKAPPPVTTGLGLSVDEMVGKSPTLTKNIETLLANGWTLEYGPEDGGSYCDRNAKKIVVDSGEKKNTKEVVQTLAHETGHALYTPDPYVQPKGLSKKEYVDANVKRDLRDEGEATLMNCQVRDEIIANGGKDIGVAGAQAKKYQKLYDACDDPNDPTQRDALRTQIGNVFKDGEQPSGEGNITYGEYYGKPYEKFWDEQKKKGNI